MSPDASLQTSLARSPRLRTWARGLCLGFGVAIIAACGLVNDLELEAPAFDRPPMLECYLTPGQPFRLLLTRSTGLLDSLELDNNQYLENLLVDSAQVFVRYGSTRVELKGGFSFDPRFRQGFNYSSKTKVPANYTDSFYLEVLLADGSSITGATKLLPAVAYDSIRLELDEEALRRGDSLARVLAYFADPNPDRIDRFHQLLTRKEQGAAAEQDFFLSDEFNSGTSLRTVSLYRFAPGKTVTVLTAHVDIEFERYFTSLQLAIASNGNPFAQPSSLMGNLRGEGTGAGALGIFTSYAYTLRDVAIFR